MCSHYSYNDKNIQMTTITKFLIPSRSDFFQWTDNDKTFLTNQNKFKGKGVPSVSLPSVNVLIRPAIVIWATESKAAGLSNMSVKAGLVRRA